jgi:hypothetical protein
MAKLISHELQAQLGELSEGDQTMYRLYLLDLLLIYLNIENEEPLYREELSKNFKGPIPMLFEEDNNLDSIVSHIQKQFVKAPKGQKGLRAKIKNRLEWYLRESGKTLKEVELAVDLYITECISINRYAKAPHTFIYQSEDSKKRNLVDSTLHEYVLRLGENDVPIYYDAYA